MEICIIGDKTNVHLIYSSLSDRSNLLLDRSCFYDKNGTIKKLTFEIRQINCWSNLADSVLSTI